MNYFQAKPPFSQPFVLDRNASTAGGLVMALPLFVPNHPGFNLQPITRNGTQGRWQTRKWPGFYSAADEIYSYAWRPKFTKIALPYTISVWVTPLVMDTGNGSYSAFAFRFPSSNSTFLNVTGWLDAFIYSIQLPSFNWLSPSFGNFSSFTVGEPALLTATIKHPTDTWIGRGYRNGVFNAQDTVTEAIGAGPQQNLEMSATGVPYTSKLLLHDLRFYNRELSDNQIYDLYDPDTRWEIYAPASPTRWYSIPSGSHVLTLTDTTQISDSILKSVGKVKSITNSINIADTISNIRTLIKSLASSINISDTISRIINKVKTITDIVGITETFPSTGILDNFNRANEGPPLGSNWLMVNEYETANVLNQHADPGDIWGEEWWNHSLNDGVEFYTTVLSTNNPGGSSAFLLFYGYPTTAKDTSDVYTFRISKAGNGGNYTIALYKTDSYTLPANLLASFTMPEIFPASFGIRHDAVGNFGLYYNTTGKWILGASGNNTLYGTGGYATILYSAFTFDDFGGGNTSQKILTSRGLFKSITNTLNISDTLSKIFNKIKSISNSIQISDTITTIRSLLKSISNSINISDTITRIIGKYKSINNSINISDILTNSIGRIKSIINTINISDTLAKSIGRYKTIADTINVSDTLTRTIAKVVAIANSVNVSDTIVNIRGIYKTLANTINIADTLASMVFEHAKPNQDITVSGWTNELDSNVDIYTSIDEITPNDTDYIKSPENPLPAEIYETKLGILSAPYLKISHSLFYRYKKSSASDIGLIVKLMQGNTEIANWNHATIPETFTTVEQTLTQDQMNSISDYTDLRIRFIPSGIQ